MSASDGAVLDLNAVEKPHVKVNVQVQCRAEALVEEIAERLLDEGAAIVANDMVQSFDAVSILKLYLYTA